MALSVSGYFRTLNKSEAIIKKGRKRHIEQIHSVIHIGISIHCFKQVSANIFDQYKEF